jgi:hypothetical protein
MCRRGTNACATEARGCAIGCAAEAQLGDAEAQLGAAEAQLGDAEAQLGAAEAQLGAAAAHTRGVRGQRGARPEGCPARWVPGQMGATEQRPRWVP